MSGCTKVPCSSQRSSATRQRSSARRQHPVGAPRGIVCRAGVAPADAARDAVPAVGAVGSSPLRLTAGERRQARPSC
eukprot:scaffold13071_cov61-Phaeocystis_antarctica.AAC.2